MRVSDRVHLASDPTMESRVVRILDAWRVRVYWLVHPTHTHREAGRPCPTGSGSLAADADLTVGSSSASSRRTDGREPA